ncbi:histidine kinase [Streptomyces tanashiensis]|uniref:sensor histidine kinase n=1 Tax=Streptomyces tanashiensis TaxID=67367 RepID=UPI0019A8EEC6|nr:sensor histidine kinase [Streptomyces tanashiensis]GGS88747.1 histidine kinase [Streptomyces tanashiensis]
MTDTAAGGPPEIRPSGGGPGARGPASRGAPGAVPAGAGDGPVRRPYFSLRAGEWVFAVAGLPVALVCGVYALAVLYAGTLLSLTVLGLPFVVVALLGARGLGRPHRHLVGALLGEHVEAPAGLPRPDGLVARGRVVLTDPVAWRTLLYLVLRLPLGVLGFAAGAGLPLACGWLIGFPLWGRLMEPDSPPGAGMNALAVLLGLVLLAGAPGALRVVAGANRRLAGLLLGPARAQRRVRELEAARAVLLADNGDRLRRLERDLHDGTQARLVALAITLSLTEDALDPAAGPDLGRLRTLLDRARGQTEETVAELRLLTRGIHPVALDGGLGEALPGLTATSPVPVAVRLDLGERPDEAIERAVYFCAAELLTNIARHSGARTAALEAAVRDGRVRLTVRDDGCGGAAPGGGTGLAGLAERLAAVDGTLRVDSPPGGPTEITAELPARL